MRVPRVTRAAVWLAEAPNVRVIVLAACPGLARRRSRPSQSGDPETDQRDE